MDHEHQVAAFLDRPETRGRLLRWAQALVRCADEAEDIVQQAMVSAWLGRRSFRGSSQVGTWIYRIVRNEALMLVRSRATTAVPLELLGLCSDEDRNVNRLFLLQLHERYQSQAGWSELLAVHYFGRTTAEVAAEQGEPVGTVKARMSRLRSSIRRAVST